MSVEIAPKLIVGQWEEGYSLDVHTLASEFLGYNSLGHPEFKTTRTPLGDLLYRLKYAGDLAALESIVDVLGEFIRSWDLKVDLLIPVPPSDPQRKQQPVLEIAKSLAKLCQISLSETAVAKIKHTGQLKNIYDYQERTSVLGGAFSVNAAETAGKRILLLDDLFRSGATLNAIASALKSQGEAATVFALTVTRTRSNV